MTKHTTKVLSWNINYTRRVSPQCDECEYQKGPYYKPTLIAFNETYSAIARFDQISSDLMFFKTQGVNLFLLQEVGIPVKDKYIEFIEEILGFKVIVKPYNENRSEFVLRHIFAYSPSFEVLNQTQVYLTTTGYPVMGPDKIANLGEDFTRSSPVFLIQNKEDNTKLVVVSVHLGLGNRHKILASELLCEKLEEFNDDNIPIIASGDFNLFDQTKVKDNIFLQQVDVWLKHGFMWASSKVKFTFIAFPYDIYRFLDLDDKDLLHIIEQNPTKKNVEDFYITAIEKHGAPLVATALDATFVKNFPESAEILSEAILMIDGNRIDPIPEEDILNKMTLEAYKDGHPLANSDHLPLLTTITYDVPMDVDVKTLYAHEEI